MSNKNDSLLNNKYLSFHKKTINNIKLKNIPSEGSILHKTVNLGP